MRNINCIYNYSFTKCRNRHIKRSLFGIGPRMCILYNEDEASCKYQVCFTQPPPPPPPPSKRLISENF
jgi:hypothetical protein